MFTMLSWSDNDCYVQLFQNQAIFVLISQPSVVYIFFITQSKISRHH
jgi:hypothetical protein